MNGGMPNGSAYGNGGSMYMNNSMPYTGAMPAGGGGASGSGSLYGQGGHYVGGSLPARSRGKTAKNNMLKNKVGNLVNAGKDVENDEEEESEFMKKLFK
jgi:hypothetical protein